MVWTTRSGSCRPTGRPTGSGSTPPPLVTGGSRCSSPPREGAAALPGVLASWSTLPVIGVPLASSELKGLDALMAVAQMPPGIPVACVAIGSWGARNAAYLAAEILGIKHDDIRESYERYRARLRER